VRSTNWVGTITPSGDRKNVCGCEPFAITLGAKVGSMFAETLFKVLVVSLVAAIGVVWEFSLLETISVDLVDSFRFPILNLILLTILIEWSSSGSGKGNETQLPSVLAFIMTETVLSGPGVLEVSGGGVASRGEGTT